jgi:hypothetical protein
MRFVNILSLALLLIPVLAPAQTEFILLDADFDDKTVDMPIGTGGPDAGEPISIDGDISTMVRENLFATPSLEIVRTLDGSTANLIFEFVGSASVDVGNVSMNMDVIFHTVDSYIIADFREQGYWSATFCQIYTISDGSIRLTDMAGYSGIIGWFVTGQPYNFQVVFDTEADTYDVYLDETPVIEGRSHGLVGMGIGRMAIKVSSSASVGAGLDIDNLLIIADEYTATARGSFSDLKHLY